MRRFLLGRVDSVSPLTVQWLAPRDPKAFLHGGWKPLMRGGKPHVDPAEFGAILMLFEPKSFTDSCESVHLTDDVIDFLKRRKLC
jgi:hypothetical protein